MGAAFFVPKVEGLNVAVAVDGFNAVYVILHAFEVMENAIRESVDPSMDAQLTAFPCALH